MRLSAFIRQKSYENVLYKVRRSAVTIIPHFLAAMFMLLAVPLGRSALLRYLPGILDNPGVSVALTIGASIYCLTVGIFFYTFFVTFYLDLLIITNDRLLYIQQLGLFSRTISELDLYKIQDITSEVKGVFASLFKYGNLLIETAGEIEKFNIKYISNPENMRQIILDLSEEDRKFHQRTTAATVQ